jgi:hypothetical protein
MASCGNGLFGVAQFGLHHIVANAVGIAGNTVYAEARPGRCPDFDASNECYGRVACASAYHSGPQWSQLQPWRGHITHNIDASMSLSYLKVWLK